MKDTHPTLAKHESEGRLARALRSLLPARNRQRAPDNASRKHGQCLRRPRPVQRLGRLLWLPKELTKKARAQVVGWLKLLENSEFRRAAGQGHHPYDTAWMWRELKVEGAR